MDNRYMNALKKYKGKSEKCTCESEGLRYDEMCDECQRPYGEMLVANAKSEMIEEYPELKNSSDIYEDYWTLVRRDVACGKRLQPWIENPSAFGLCAVGTPVSREVKP